MRNPGNFSSLTQNFNPKISSLCFRALLNQILSCHVTKFTVENIVTVPKKISDIKIFYGWNKNFRQKFRDSATKISAEKSVTAFQNCWHQIFLCYHEIFRNVHFKFPKQYSWNFVKSRVFGHKILSWKFRKSDRKNLWHWNNFLGCHEISIKTYHNTLFKRLPTHKTLVFISLEHGEYNVWKYHQSKDEVEIYRLTVFLCL